jgi:hypothetical protein
MANEVVYPFQHVRFYCTIDGAREQVIEHSHNFVSKWGFRQMYVYNPIAIEIQNLICLLFGIVVQQFPKFNQEVDDLHFAFDWKPEQSAELLND